MPEPRNEPDPQSSDLQNAPAPTMDFPAKVDGKGLDDGSNSLAAGAAGSLIAGKYKLLECIGEGGMGSVWSAEQREPVKRMVAIKLIKKGMDSRAVLARFEAERQALAVMDHPNIARIFDGGVAESGAPYFVMELVRGVPITQFCDARRYSLQQRLEIFIPICQAIQHAHQKGIIHRDIKPSNVMVAVYDDRPVPKVIDFGVAKATGVMLGDSSPHTGLGNLVGTPEYMSPEQAGLNSVDIDTRSDVYSLGVLLYELLAGSTPFRREDLERAGFLEILRVIREEDPPRPSTKLSTADALPSLSANRRAEPRTLTGILRNELDWIVMKALEKDRVLRYETANAFAADVSRYLAGEAIQAHPPSRAYRLKKFLRKHRASVTAASFIVLSLVAGVIGTTYGLIRADQQRKLAQANLKTADENYQLARKAVDRYLTQVGDHRLLNEPYMDELRKELLNSAREFYQEFSQRRRDDPSALRDLADAHARLADIAWKLGEHASAIQELEASRTVSLTANPMAGSEVPMIQTGIRLGSYRMQTGKLDDALQALDQTLQAAEERQQLHPGDAESRNLIARILDVRAFVHRQQGHRSESEADLARATEILEPVVAENPSIHAFPRDLSNIYISRGQLAYESRDDDAAEEWYRKALNLRRGIVALEEKSVEARAGLSGALTNLAGVLRRKKQYAEAIQWNEESVGILRKLASEHPGLAKFQSDLAGSLNNLGIIRKVSGDVAVADVLNAEALEVLASIARQHPTVTNYAFGLGTAEGNEGNSRLAAEQWEQAIHWYDRSIATLTPLLAQSKSNDPRVRSVLRNDHWGRADAFVSLKKFNEAVTAYDRTLEMADEKTQPEIRMARALALAKSGDYRAARAAVDAETSTVSASKLVWFDGSKVLATAAVAAQNDVAVAEDARALLVKELQVQCVKSLRTAFEKGYFANPDSQREFSLPVFEPLRDLPEFRQLLQDVKNASPNKSEKSS